MPCIVFYLESGSPIITKLDEVEVVTVGRHPDSVVKLDSGSVSSHHATVKKRADGYYVQDLGSMNGTRLNGAEMEEALLKDGDRVAFGDVQAVYYAGEPPPLEELTASAAPASKAPLAPPPPRLSTEQRPMVGIPPTAPRKPRKVSARNVSGYPDQTGSGCGTAILLTVLFLAAFSIGLALRHYKDTERNLFEDLLEKVTNQIPKIQIEQK